MQEIAASCKLRFASSRSSKQPNFQGPRPAEPRRPTKETVPVRGSLLWSWPSSTTSSFLKVLTLCPLTPNPLWTPPTPNPLWTHSALDLPGHLLPSGAFTLSYSWGPIIRVRLCTC